MSWMFPTIVILFPHISIVSCIDVLIFDFPKASKTVWNFPFDPHTGWMVKSHVFDGHYTHLDPHLVVCFNG